MLMVFDKMVLSVFNQGYLIVREAAVLLSWLVDGILCSLLSDGLSLSLHLVLCWFSPVSVLCFVAMLSCQMFVGQEVLTDISDNVWWWGLSTR